MICVSGFSQETGGVSALSITRKNKQILNLHPKSVKSHESQSCNSVQRKNTTERRAGGIRPTEGLRVEQRTGRGN